MLAHAAESVEHHGDHVKESCFANKYNWQMFSFDRYIEEMADKEIWIHVDSNFSVIFC